MSNIFIKCEGSSKIILTFIKKGEEMYCVHLDPRHSRGEGVEELHPTIFMNSSSAELMNLSDCLKCKHGLELLFFRCKKSGYEPNEISKH